LGLIRGKIPFAEKKKKFMPKNPRILAFAGSLREKSYSKRVLKVAVEGARRAGAEVTLIDLKDYPMPIYSADLQDTQGFPPIATALQKLMLEHDGLLIASPEFNASLPAVLKNAIDWTSRPNENLKLGECYRGKVAAIISASPGSFGGIRCLGHLRDVLTILLVHTLPQEIAVAKVGGLFEDDGDEMTNSTVRGILEDLGASLVETLRKMHGTAANEEDPAPEANAAGRLGNSP
jgi:NAD(P)H-dependent FMN reductase